jgi:hypothetical protein
MGTDSFPGVKRPGRGVDHPPQSSAEVKEGVELYLYSPCGPSLPVLEWTWPLTLYIRVTSLRCQYGDRHKQRNN